MEIAFLASVAVITAGPESRKLYGEVLGLALEGSIVCISYAPALHD